MLRSERVLLRPVERADVPTLAGWDSDPAVWPEISLGPYEARPVADLLKRYDDSDPSSDYRPSDKAVPFAVVAGEELVGCVTLWGIDLHNRRGHLGLNLGPEHRGKGYGSEACRLLLRYAFVEEGRLRQSAWVRGELVDEVVMSVLATEWSSRA